MKKIVLLMIIFVFLFPLTAKSEYVYKGDESIISTTSDYIVTLPLVVDTSSLDTKVFYGFYTGEGTVGTDSSDGTTYQKLVFNESITKISGTTYTYKAVANIKFYVYILSSDSFKLSLKWTHLSGYLYYERPKWSFSSGYTTETKTQYDDIPVTINIKNNTCKSNGTSIGSATAYEIDTFAPSSDGILIHRDYSYEAITDEYTNKYSSYTISSYSNYTGTMALILSTI